MPKGMPPSIVLASILSVVNIIIICLPGEDMTGIPLLVHSDMVWL